MRIERVAAPDDRAPDRLDALVKLHRPPVEIPPQPALEVDAEIGELTGPVGRCHRLGSHAASLGPCGQRHLRRLARPRARQPPRTRAGHVATGPVDHQIADEQLLRRTVTGLIDRLALDLHAGPAGDLRHLRLLAAALRFVGSKLERPVEDHVERAGPEIGRAPLGDDGVDEAGLGAIEVESALPAHVEGARRAGGGRWRRGVAGERERLQRSGAARHRQRELPGAVDGEPILAPVKLHHRSLEVEPPALHDGGAARHDRLGVRTRRPRQLHLVAADVDARLGGRAAGGGRKRLLDEVHLPLHRHLVDLVARGGQCHLPANERRRGDHLAACPRRRSLPRWGGDHRRRRGSGRGQRRSGGRRGHGCGGRGKLCWSDRRSGRRFDGPEPEFEPIGPGRQLFGVGFDHAAGEQPRRPDAREVWPGRGIGLRGPRALHDIEPEMDLGGREPALRLHGDVGIARERDHVPLPFGPHPQPLLPPGLRRRRLLRPHAEPARAHGHQRTRVARRSGAVVDLAGLHLGAFRHERHRLLAVEQDPPGRDLVAEPCRPHLQFRTGRAGHDRRALRLNLHRLEPTTDGGRRGHGSTVGRLGLPGEHDRQQVARELFGGPVGSGPDHVDVFLEGDHVGRHVHAQRAAAADEHGGRGGGFAGRRRSGPGSGRIHRGRRRSPGKHAPGQALDPHLHVAVEPDRVDTADVGPLVG